MAASVLGVFRMLLKIALHAKLGTCAVSCRPLIYIMHFKC